MTRQRDAIGRELDGPRPTAEFPYAYVPSNLFDAVKNFVRRL
jgi:hypothetical protein